MTNEQQAPQALDWNSPIAMVEDKPFVVLPAGEVNFTILKFERKSYQPSQTSKIPDCKWEAVLTVEIDNGQAKTTIKHSLYLHTKCLGFLSQFLVAVGQRQHGDTSPIQPNWEGSVGVSGRCKIKARLWTDRNTGQAMLNDDGTQKASNEIDRFLEPAKQAAQPAQTTFTANTAWKAQA